ncbi:hypothetical protein [Novosphingobium huizhouense]|uniref:hypothetical protein n=1 Tax=Novosphingobium huizhouense TaxID=2866625 RepID=UPI001CD86574|nr:hypothetical protein [Novosphingobium huizhouense]
MITNRKLVTLRRLQVASAALAVTLLALALAGCGPDRAKVARDVEDYGFTDVRIGDREFWRCGKDDSWGFRFTAVNPLGREVHGVVCGGAFKGATVRMTGGAA